MKYGKKCLGILLALLLMLGIMAGCAAKPDATLPMNDQGQSSGEAGDTTEPMETTEATEPTETTKTTETTEATEATEVTEATEATEVTEATEATEAAEPVHTHSWKAATCTAPKTCKTCKATEGNAKGHSWKAATCTAPRTCKTCKATKGDADVDAHSWKAATCTAPKTCKRCKATEGSAAGHSWKAATCTAPKTCKLCKATEGKAAGHTWNDATCKAPKTCSLCAVTEGKPSDHSYANGACAVCGDSQYDDISKIDGKKYYTWFVDEVKYEDEDSGETVSYNKLRVHSLFYSSNFPPEYHGESYSDGENTAYSSDGGYLPKERFDGILAGYVPIYEGQEYLLCEGGDPDVRKAEIIDNCLVVPYVGKFALQKDGYLVLIEYTGGASEDSSNYIPVGTLYSTDQFEFVDGYNYYPVEIE